MTDRRTKFVRKSQTSEGWEYGYTEAEIRLKERKVTEHVVGHALTLQDASVVWLAPQSDCSDNQEQCNEQKALRR